MRELTLKSRRAPGRPEPSDGLKAAGPRQLRLARLANALNASASVAGSGALQAKAVVQRQGDGDSAMEASEAEASEAEALYRSVGGELDLAEDEGAAADPDYDPSRDSDDSGGSDDDEDDDDDGISLAMDESEGSSKAPMSLEARKAIDAGALARPLAQSLLHGPDSRFPVRTMETNDKFKVAAKQTRRTEKSGPVSITLQSIILYVGGKAETRERPIAVSGIVEPTVTTGRGGAPDAVSGLQIYSGQGPQPASSVKTERNSGMPDAERGHVMALELGGPDIPQNIVPQWAKFQGSGKWRQMEREVLRQATDLPEGKRLRYSVDIFYKRSGGLTPTLKTFGVPTGFHATTREVEGEKEGPVNVVFHQGQSQDETDQMLAERRMRKADDRDWDSGLDAEKAGGKRKRASAAESGGKKKKASGD